MAAKMNAIAEEKPTDNLIIADYISLPFCPLAVLFTITNNLWLPQRENAQTGIESIK